jgi:hypothetical protein
LFTWVDATANTSLDSSGASVGTVIPTTWGGQVGTPNANYGGLSKLIYTPITNQTVKLRIISGLGSGSIMASQGTYAKITQVANQFALTSISGLTTTGDVNVGGNLGVTGNTIVTGGIRKSARVLTTTTTLTIADASGFIEFTPGSGPYTITLPNPTLAANSGIGYRFWQNTTDNITLSTPGGAFYGPSGSNTSTKVLTQATTQYWDVWSDGFNWSVFAIKMA